MVGVKTIRPVLDGVVNGGVYATLQRGPKCLAMHWR